MASLVYALCALASLMCSVLLLRSYSQTKVKLLLWSSLCFLGLALNNGLLVVDHLLIPSADLLTWRKVPAVVGVSLLVYGLVTDTR